MALAVDLAVPYAYEVRLQSLAQSLAKKKSRRRKM